MGPDNVAPFGIAGIAGRRSIAVGPLRPVRDVNPGGPVRSARRFDKMEEGPCDIRSWCPTSAS